MKLSSDDCYKLILRIVDYMNSINDVKQLKIINAHYSVELRTDVLSAVIYCGPERYMYWLTNGKDGEFTYYQMLKWLLLDDVENADTWLRSTSFIHKDMSLTEVDLQLAIRGF